MAIRTSDEAVRDSIETDANIPTMPFIQRASALVDYVVSKDSNSILNASLQEQIEICLACHFYERRDHAYAQEKQGDASATYQGQFGLGLDGTKWGQDAKLLDVTGTLAGLGKGKVQAEVEWLGRPPSEQTDYIDRD